MKKIFILLSIFLLCTAANAADLKFTPDGGGKFIYCNNNEFIRRSDLADISNPNPEYIMENKGLKSGKYTLYFSHINHTEVTDFLNRYPDSAEAPESLTAEELKDLNKIKETGFDIEVDVRFCAKGDTVIKFTALGFEAQSPKNYYLKNRLVNYEDRWSSLSCLADYFKAPILSLDSEYSYQPRPFEEKTVTVKDGEDFWLSEIIENYASVGWLKPVMLISDFEIVKGEADVFVAALKSDVFIRQRRNLAENIAPGRYYRDGQYKGVANSLPSVTAPLSFEIDDSVKDGSRLNVTIYNQYVPDGLEVSEWHTNINPQNDSNVRRSAAESDILPLTYKDETKLSLYGDDVEDKSDIWYFDTKHSATRNSGKPNYPLDTIKYSVKKAVGLANYCVKNNYKIKIKNNSKNDRYFRYNANCTADLLAWVTFADGTRQLPYIVSKGQNDSVREKTLAEVKLEAGKETEFTLTVFLPINNTGAILNSFSIESEPAEFKFNEDLKISSVVDKNFTGKDYVALKGGAFIKSGDRKEGEVIFPTDEVKKIISGNERRFKVKRLGDKYVLYYADFVETPAYYSVEANAVSTVYFLNDDFSLSGKVGFANDLVCGFPFMFSYAGGKYYIRGGSTMASADTVNWERQDFIDEGKFLLPLEAGKIILLPKEDGDYYLSPDGGENYYRICYPENAKKPRYIEVMGDLFCYASGNVLYTSPDGIFWDTFDAGEKITSLSRQGENFFINEKIFASPEKRDLTKNVVIGGKLIVFPEGTIENSGDVLVPAEKILAEANLKFNFEKKTGTKNDTLTVKSGKDEFKFNAGSNAVYKNGKKSFMDNSCMIKDGVFYLPAQNAFETLGFDTKYFESTKVLVIK